MKVSIIGAGRVGSTTAFLLLERKLADELVLLDIVEERAMGEALDLMHCASSFGKAVSVTGSSDYASLRDSDIIVITAGIPRKLGDTRLDLLKKNTGIMQDIVGQLVKHNKHAIILVVSNPVEVMTYVAYKTSGFEYRKVFGLGTMLDSIRFKSILAEKLGLPPSEVQTVILGEHGDSMFPVYSQTFIKGKTVEKSGLLSREGFYKTAEEVRKSAAEVIKLKGATFYAPAVAVVEVLDSIIGDKNRILPLSIYSKEHEIYISTLAKVRAFGVQLAHTQLDDEEKRLFEESVNVLKKACAETGV